MAEITGKSTSGAGNVNTAAVDSGGRLVVRADTETDMNHAMGVGLGYIFHSTYSASAGEEIFYLQNTGADIHVHRVVVSTSASGIFQILRQTSGTAAGTTITGKNGILGRPVMPAITAFGDASVTGSVDGEILLGHDIGTSEPFEFDTEDLIIPDTEALVVRAVTTGIVHVTCLVFRETTA